MTNNPVLPVNVNPNVITVSHRQQGNPVLKYIRNVRWQYGDILPDYILGQSTVALFLSLRYHLLNPNYVHSRIKEIGRAYRLRVLLVFVDTEDAVEPLAQVTRAAIGNEFTLLCGFSNAECGRYLETLKSYEKKPAEIIQKDLGTDYVSRATAALTTIRGVNRTDVKTLGDRFGSMAAVLQASEAELKACPGVGPVKAKRLFET
jgi:DNA excision repair protein ERCC-1